MILAATEETAAMPPTPQGWLSSDFLPSRFDACFYEDREHGRLIVVRYSDNSGWGWSVDFGRNWGKGNRNGRVATLNEAVRGAVNAYTTETGTLF